MPHGDKKIKEEIVEALTSSSEIDASSIAVFVKDGIATLTGETSSYHAQSVALDLAWGVIGVIEVENNIAIRDRTSSHLPADEELLGRVDAILEWNPQTRNEDIHATVSEGLVTLEGSVDSHWKRRYIGELVRELQGVTGLHNLLAIVPGRSVHDQFIAEDLMTTLRKNPIVNPDRIEVRVDNGDITFTGQVGSQSEREEIEEAAAKTPGVVTIHNRLTVSSAAA